MVANIINPSTIYLTEGSTQFVKAGIYNPEIKLIEDARKAEIPNDK